MGGSQAGDGQGLRVDRAREVGLFRYALIREAEDSSLSSRERGQLVRAFTEAEHVGPFGAGCGSLGSV